MTLSILRDALILFLLIYAVLDLSNQVIHYITNRIFCSDKANAGVLLMPLASLLPACAEYQIRKAEKLASPLLLITDDCDADTLEIAKRLAKESDTIQLIDGKTLSLSTVQDAFSADSEAAGQDLSK